MSKINSICPINLATASFPVLLTLESRVSQYKIYGAKAISANCTIDPTGTPKEGMVVLIDYEGVVITTTADSRFGDFSLAVFGVKVPYSWLAKKSKIWCEYHNSAWSVFILPSVDSLPFIKAEALHESIVDDTTLGIDTTTGEIIIKDLGVSTAKIEAKAVTLAKLVDITRGSIIVGGATNLPVELSAKTSAQVLVGDGTDVKSVAISGDVTMSAAGVFAIGASKILAAMIKAKEIVASHLSDTAAILMTQLAALTASKIPVLNASGFIEAGTVNSDKLSFIDVTAGTAEASKSIVLDANKQIDELDIIAPKINGVAVEATAAEINYLSGATSNLQTQISAIGNVVSWSKILTTTVLTSTTLKKAHTSDSQGGAINLTLPLISTMEEGQVVEINNVGANGTTVLKNASDPSFINKAGGEVSSIALADGVSSKFIIDGIYWRQLR